MISTKPKFSNNYLRFQITDLKIIIFILLTIKNDLNEN